MRPIEATTNLELSREIKKFGYPQEGSLWYWIAAEFEKTRLVDGFVARSYHEKELFAAPSVAEWGEILKDPNQIILSHHRNLPVWTGSSWVLYRNGKVIFEADTEANARAKLWIHLKKEGLV